jgi:hypothetical protein
MSIDNLYLAESCGILRDVSPRRDIPVKSSSLRLLVVLAIVGLTLAGAQKKPKCADSLATCPVTGCVGGDPELNKLKNRVDSPKEGAIDEMSISDIIALEDDQPDTWTRGRARKELSDLGEGKAIVVKGYLIHAKGSGAETCNCRLTGGANNDIHMNIVRRKVDPREESLVVEMTPRIRAKEPRWTLKKLTTLADEEEPPYVRVTGWLLLDTEHISGNGGPRATVWEIHPITQFEVCEGSRKSCDGGQNWKALAQIE